MEKPINIRKFLLSCCNGSKINKGKINFKKIFSVIGFNIKLLLVQEYFFVHFVLYRNNVSSGKLFLK